MIRLTKPINEMSAKEVMDELMKEIKRIVWENTELKREIREKNSIIAKNKI